jgi:hypothetical protein
MGRIPGPDERDFWEEVAGKGQPADPLRVDNVIGKLATSMPVLYKPDPHRRSVAQLAAYLLMFFGGEPRGLPESIGRRFAFTMGADWEAVGRLWLEDLIATCWRLYVRHADPRTRLTEWPDDYHAWFTRGQEDAGD